MANRNDYNKHGSEPGNMGKYYMVDTARVFKLDVYEGINERYKPERQMITQVCIWLWYGLGLPCWVVSMIAFVFGWIHIGDVKSFITLSIAVITSVSKVVIMWAEKGDIVKDRVRRLLTKRKRYKH